MSEDLLMYYNSLKKRVINKTITAYENYVHYNLDRFQEILEELFRTTNSFLANATDLEPKKLMHFLENNLYEEALYSLKSHLRKYEEVMSPNTFNDFYSEVINAYKSNITTLIDTMVDEYTKELNKKESLKKDQNDERNYVINRAFDDIRKIYNINPNMRLEEIESFDPDKIDYYLNNKYFTYSDNQHVIYQTNSPVKISINISNPSELLITIYDKNHAVEIIHSGNEYILNSSVYTASNKNYPSKSPTTALGYLQTIDQDIFYNLINIPEFAKKYASELQPIINRHIKENEALDAELASSYGLDDDFKNTNPYARSTFKLKNNVICEKNKVGHAIIQVDDKSYSISKSCYSTLGNEENPEIYTDYFFKYNDRVFILKISSQYTEFVGIIKPDEIKEDVVLPEDIELCNYLKTSFPDLFNYLVNNEFFKKRFGEEVNKLMGNVQNNDTPTLDDIKAMMHDAIEKGDMELLNQLSKAYEFLSAQNLDTDASHR